MTAARAAPPLLALGLLALPQLAGPYVLSLATLILLGPVIGGVGTLLGPIVGSLVLTLLSDGMTELLAALGWELPGTKQVVYGLALLLVVVFLPHGVWPALHERWHRRRGAARPEGALP